jgi:hypothetical protein
MAEYRLYCLDEGGGFSKVHEIHALDDADAEAKARSLRLGVACELWEKDRLVAKIPACAEA